MSSKKRQLSNKGLVKERPAKKAKIEASETKTKVKVDQKEEAPTWATVDPALVVARPRTLAGFGSIYEQVKSTVSDNGTVHFYLGDDIVRDDDGSVLYRVNKWRFVPGYAHTIDFEFKGVKFDSVELPILDSKLADGKCFVKPLCKSSGLECYIIMDGKGRSAIGNCDVLEVGVIGAIPPSKLPAPPERTSWVKY